MKILPAEKIHSTSLLSLHNAKDALETVCRAHAACLCTAMWWGGAATDAISVVSDLDLVLFIRSDASAQVACLLAELYRCAEVFGVDLDILVATKDTPPPVLQLEELQLLCEGGRSPIIYGDAACIRSLPRPRSSHELVREAQAYSHKKLLKSVQIARVIARREDPYGNPEVLAQLSKVLSSPKHMLRKLAQLKGVRREQESVWLAYVSTQMSAAYQSLDALIDQYRFCADVLLVYRGGKHRSSMYLGDLTEDQILSQYADVVAKLGTDGVLLVQQFFEGCLSSPDAFKVRR